MKTFNLFRRKVYDVIDFTNVENNYSKFYDSFMLIMIILSLVPLAFKTYNIVFFVIEKTAMTIFIIDYILRFATADYKYGEKGIKPFIKYPFSFMAIVDLLSILPYLIFLRSGSKYAKLLKSMKTIRIVRVIKIFRYSKNTRIFINVFNKSKSGLITVGTMAIAYIFISALVIFNIEPETFKTFFDAMYWATVSLTTVGYGDIYPVTTAGKIITMVSAFFGIAIVALPAGIITAGFMQELDRDK